MALIAALERRIPIFAICRGLQELVVATGGTLYRRLFEQPEPLNTAKILNCPSSSNTPSISSGSGRRSCLN
jgi:gamma-glutamyl-gamma-aminobutyrate hydrolase PuuD